VVVSICLLSDAAVQVWEGMQALVCKCVCGLNV